MAPSRPGCPVRLKASRGGRKTGAPYQTVAMVLRYDEQTGEAMFCAGWGPETDWYRNLHKHPAVKVKLGGRSKYAL